MTVKEIEELGKAVAEERLTKVDNAIQFARDSLDGQYRKEQELRNNLLARRFLLGLISAATNDCQHESGLTRGYTPMELGLENLRLDVVKFLYKKLGEVVNT